MSRRFLILCLMLLLVSSIALAAESEQGGTFIYPETTDFGEMFNPILYEQNADSFPIAMVYDGLVDYNSALEIVPRMTESFEISEDGTSYTFYLRKGIKFHDGHEFTAEDVAYTYTTLVHPDYTGVRGGDFMCIVGARDFNEGKADTVKGIEIIDDYTIKFTTDGPDSAFLGSLTYGILPAHILKDIPVAQLENNEFNRHPVGTGPFVFTEYVSQQYLICEAFDDYYRGRPKLDRIMITRVAESSLPMLFEQRKIDYAGLTADHFEKVKEYPHIKSYTGARFALYYMGVNQTRPEFADNRVKQALLYGFNRDIMVRALMKGYAEVANSLRPSVSWAYNNDLKPYNFNQVIARKLLDEAGYNKFDKDGTRINAEGRRLELEFFTAQGSDTNINVAELFQQMMKLIGVKVNITLMEFNALLDRVYDPEGWHFYMMSWNLSPDPDWSFALRSDAAWNDVFFVNEESDALLDAGRKELDPEKRKAIYNEWQTLVMEELPYYPLAFPLARNCVDQRIQGLNTNPGPLGLFYDESGYLLHKIWIPSDQRIHSEEE